MNPLNAFADGQLCHPVIRNWQQKPGCVLCYVVMSSCFVSLYLYELYYELGVALFVVVISSGLPEPDGVKPPPRPDGSIYFDRFPRDIQGRVLSHLPYEGVVQLKKVSKNLKDLVESDEFQALPSTEKPILTSCYIFVQDETWQWAGLDSSLEKWRRLPSLTFLPDNCKPDPDLFKEFLICANGGLVCVNFSKSPDVERLIVFNPLTEKYRELPPLIHQRNPVLMHMLVDPDSQSYQVIVAGSSRSGDESLSKITEVYDSRTGKWNRSGDLPGPVFALNEYQSGVYQDGKLFCIGFVETHDLVIKGIMAYNVEECKWLPEWTHPLTFSMSSTILQLVNCSGEVFLFSERENGSSTEHWVDRVEWTVANKESEKDACQLINVVKEKKVGGRSLEVYPEHTCVPYDEGRLCIVNAIDHSGVVYDIREQGQAEYLPVLPAQGFRGELGFFSLNPISFTIGPSFSSKV